MKKASNAPTYVGMYPELAELFKEHGYALAIHGSVQTDFDLIAVAWRDDVTPPNVVVEELREKFWLIESELPEVRSHDRLVYTLVISYGECYIDLSFTNYKPLFGDKLHELNLKETN